MLQLEKQILQSQCRLWAHLGNTVLVKWPQERHTDVSSERTLCNMPWLMGSGGRASSGEVRGFRSLLLPDFRGCERHVGSDFTPVALSLRVSGGVDKTNPGRLNVLAQLFPRGRRTPPSVLIECLLHISLLLWVSSSRCPLYL